MKKGSISIGVVVLVVIGVVAAGVIVTGILSPTVDNYDNSTNAGLENASNNTNFATCVAECREKNPGDRSQFMSCRSSNGCPPR